MTLLAALVLLLPTVAHAGKVETLPDGTRIELHSKGKGSKAPLRYAFEEGREWELGVRTALDVTATVGATEQNPPVPDTYVSVRFVADKVEDGVLHYTSEVTESRVADPDSVDPAVLAAVEAELAKESGGTQSGTVSPRGVTTGANDDNAVVFPDKPVATGASWTVRVSTNSGGVPVEQATTYTLTAWDGHTAEVDVETEITNTSTEAQLPNLPPGSSATIDSFESSGTGAMTLDLRQYGATSMDLNVSLDMALTITAGGQEMPMTNKVVTRMVSE